MSGSIRARRGTLELLFLLGFVVPVVTQEAVAQETTSREDAVEKRARILRERMVDRQILRRGIKSEAVLAAQRRVPRHRLVPEKYRARAYDDTPLPIGFGQTISQPYIVALMTDLLELAPGDRVLEVGTGSGYQAAVLAEIVREVYTIEIYRELHDRTVRSLSELGYDRIHFAHGDGALGWEAKAPFDAIIVTCAATHVPTALIQQLKPEGRMCIPVGPPFGAQRLLLVEKSAEGKVSTRTITQVSFVPLLAPKNAKRASDAKPPRP